jgi:hypothetical protein
MSLHVCLAHEIELSGNAISTITGKKERKENEREGKKGRQGVRNRERKERKKDGRKEGKLLLINFYTVKSQNRADPPLSLFFSRL